MSNDSLEERLRVTRAVHDAHRALCRATTREDLEQAVCGALADSDPYAFAWIGGHDDATDAVVPRAAAGPGEDSLADRPVSDEGTSGGDGPTAEAVRTAAVQVQRDVRYDHAHDPGDQRAAGRGYASRAAVPLADGDRHYGVLSVYTDRPDAFDEAERRLLGELGDSVAVSLSQVVSREELRAETDACERDLERLERRLDAIARTTSETVYIKDRDNEYRFVNEAAAAVVDADPAEVVGKTEADLFDAEHAEDIRTHDREVMESGESITREWSRSVDGEEHVVRDTRFPYRDEDGEVIGVIGVGREITDRTERERELRHTSNTLEAIIEASPNPILMLDENLEATVWNPAAERVFGWSREEVIGERSPHVPEEKEEEFLAFIEELDEGGANEAIDTVRRAKDGERVDVGLSSGKVEADDGTAGYLAVFKDIRRRKEYERRLEEQRDELELLNQMVRHDIRNDLQILSGYADLLVDRVDDDDREYAEKILASAKSAVELTQSARDLSEVMLQSEDNREPIPLDATLTRQLDDIRATHSDVSVTVDGEIPAVTVVANEMLSSVFRNLVKNAIQHNDADVPKVSVSAAVRDDVEIRVADNGPGIPEDRKDEIFGRGEKGLESKGSGIGLYLVDTLLDNYDGTVRIEDNKPRGTIFVVELPLANDEA